MDTGSGGAFRGRSGGGSCSCRGGGSGGSTKRQRSGEVVASTLAPGASTSRELSATCSAIEGDLPEILIGGGDSREGAKLATKAAGGAIRQEAVIYSLADNGVKVVVPQFQFKAAVPLFRVDGGQVIGALALLAAGCWLLCEWDRLAVRLGGR